MNKKARLIVTDKSDAEFISYVEEKMESLLDSEIEFDVVENKKILAGFICEIDGKVYSNSVAAKLTDIKKSLLRR